MSTTRNQIDNLLSVILNSLSSETEKDFFHFLNQYNFEKNCDLLKPDYDIDNVMVVFEQVYSIYYNKTSQIYYNYNGQDYVLFNDDDILHLILEYITNNSHVNTLQKS